MRLAESLLAPIAADLPVHGVHADITDYNVIAIRDHAGRWMPSGLIDFGDLISTWRISDLGVGIQSVVLHDPERALEIAAAVVRGFNEAVPLQEAEIEAVWPLVLARASVEAVTEEHQAALEPDNAYAQRSVGDGWRVLDGLDAIPPALALETLRSALHLGPSMGARAAARRLADAAAGAVPMVVPASIGDDRSVGADRAAERWGRGSIRLPRAPRSPQPAVSAAGERPGSFTQRPNSSGRRQAFTSASI